MSSYIIDVHYCIYQYKNSLSYAKKDWYFTDAKRLFGYHMLVVSSEFTLHILLLWTHRQFVEMFHIQHAPSTMFETNSRNMMLIQLYSNEMMWYDDENHYYILASHSPMHETNIPPFLLTTNIQNSKVEWHGWGNSKNILPIGWL